MQTESNSIDGVGIQYSKDSIDKASGKGLNGSLFEALCKGEHNVFKTKNSNPKYSTRYHRPCNPGPECVVQIHHCSLALLLL